MPAYQTMDASANDHIDTAEKVRNIREFGEPVPWEFVSSKSVYTVDLETPEGKQLSLTQLRTFRHEYTGEEQSWLSGDSESHFVFHGEWPIDDVVSVQGEHFHPYEEAKL